MIRALAIGALVGFIIASLWFGPHVAAQTNIVTLYGCTSATVNTRPCTIQPVAVSSTGVLQAVAQ